MVDQGWLESYEREEWHSVGGLQIEVQRYREYAASWLEQNRLVSVTLPAGDLEMLKEKAKNSGVSYQSLLTDLVRRFVSGDFPVEAN